MRQDPQTGKTFPTDSTVDVLIILPVEKIDSRYFGHFGPPGELKSRVAGDD